MAMNSLSAHLRRRRSALAAICSVVLATVVVPVALAAAAKPQAGYYTSAKGQRSVAFSVARQHGRYVVTNFTIQCFVNDNSLGAILFAGPTSVSGDGSFAFSGSAKHIANGTLAGSATIKFSGSFVSSTKVTGTASFSKAKQSGCPGTAFTATVSKSLSPTVATG
jgi:hypothetical protein